jgi:hypothetical protein
VISGVEIDGIDCMVFPQMWAFASEVRFTAWLDEPVLQ